MGVIYLGARLLGRTLIPLAAVLLAGAGMLLVSPTLIASVGFQLTVLVTAAIIRWAPTLADRIPGPRRLGLAITVPVVAPAVPLTVTSPVTKPLTNSAKTTVKSIGEASVGSAWTTA